MQLMRISKHLRYKKKYFNYFSFSNSLLYLENTLLAEPNKKKNSFSGLQSMHILFERFVKVFCLLSIAVNNWVTWQEYFIQLHIF